MLYKNIISVQSKFLRQSSCRIFSSQHKLVDMEVNDKTGIATVTLNRSPVNSLSLELLKDLSVTLDEVHDNRSKGMILTSSQKTIFCAGLDITELHKANVERLAELWSTLQDVFFKLHGSTYPTAAAINGHSPAGGCFLATCCEYRVMVPNYKIGLNEVHLGIPVPFMVQAAMRNVLTTRKAELALTLGTLFSTDEALKVGLIDEIAADKSEAILKCEQFLEQFSNLPFDARSITKQGFRAKDTQSLEEIRKIDVQQFVASVNQESIQKVIEVYLANLRNKK